MLITVKAKAQDTQARRGDGVKLQCCRIEFRKTLKLLPCEHQAAWISRAWNRGGISVVGNDVDNVNGSIIHPAVKPFICLCNACWIRGNRPFRDGSSWHRRRMPKVESSGQIKLSGGHAEFGGNRLRKGGGFAALLMEISMALLGQ